MHTKYGKHTVFLGASKLAHQSGRHDGARGHLPHRRREFLPGETTRKRLGILMFLGEVTSGSLGLYVHFLLVQAIHCTKPRLHR